MILGGTMAERCKIEGKYSVLFSIQCLAVLSVLLRMKLIFE
uniref:Uncharacterized protein n=1 Tax=Arundo donax TaxID=35708 RepID=A0A0A9H5I4_ARUDO